MARFKLGFRPHLWPTLFTVPAVIFMAGLSVWQLERRTWKWDLIETRQSRIAAPPVKLPQTHPSSAFEYRRVALRGTYLHDRELYLGARSMRSNPGYHILTPMALTGGGVILVNRGWVPLARKDPAKRSAGQIDGEVEIVAHIRFGRKSGWLTPDNEPAKNFWFYVDVPAMTAHAKLKNARTFYVQAAGKSTPGVWPRPVPIRINLPNNHLQYAITWLLLALALGVIYVLYHRRREPA